MVTTSVPSTLILLAPFIVRALLETSSASSTNVYVVLPRLQFHHFRAAQDLHTEVEWLISSRQV
jgi:hypothetical protein